MTRGRARSGVSVKVRPVFLSILMAASTLGLQAIPSDIPLPIDRPAELQPKTAAAVTCSTHPLFTGHLTANASSTAKISRITDADINHYISNIDRDWSCDTLFRYSGTSWNTSASAGTFKWGNLWNSTSPNCYWIVGTDDFTKDNSTTDCPDSISEYAYHFTLSPQGVYTNDNTHDSTGDMGYAHSACDVYLGANVTKTGASFSTSATNNRPSGANCDPITLDGQGTDQTVTLDYTAPTTAFTAPSGAPGTKVYRTSVASYNVVRTITETVAGFGGSSTWKLQRQVVPLTTPNTCGTTWVNDTASGHYTTGITTGSVSTAQTLVNQKCYRWLANATDLNGNAMAQVTSATLVVDASPPVVGFTAPSTGSTIVLNGTSYSVNWTEAEVGTGIASRSLQRRVATYSAGVCGTYGDDPPIPTSTAVSPHNATSLVDGKCYQWRETVTDVAGNQTIVTSGTVRVDIGSPSANFSTPNEGTTTIQTGTSYSVAWTETAGSGSITGRSLQRQKGPIAAGSCTGVTFANDGAVPTSTAVSPFNDTSLATGNCYRWVQTLTNFVPKTGASTSGMVLVDATAPTGSIASPETNRPVAGIVTIEGSATDAGSFRDYTLDYGAGSVPASWTTIGTFTVAVSGTGLDTILGAWNTTGLAGVHTVRLSIRDWAGNALSPVTRTVYVENSRRGEETYYERTPFDLGGGWNVSVGLANGEATLSRDLFAIPSYGPAQSLTLTYSSLETTAAGRFGYGWSSNLTQFLSFDIPNNVVVWHRADGGRVPFGNIGGTWTPLRGHFETLTSTGSEYTITLKDQTKYIFENSGNGRLKRIENRFGKALALVWNTSSATATDASSRVMDIDISSPNNRITDITDSAGRTWTFGYAGGSTNDLVSITDPAGKVTTLAYDGSHRLTSVSRTRTPASGGAVTVTWGVGYTSGKVTSVTDPVNASVSNTFTYNTGNTVVGLLKEYSPVVRNTTTYEYDDLGRITKRDQLVDPNSIPPTIYTTTWEYDDVERTLVVTQPVAGPPFEDQTVTYEFDANGNVTEETAELNDTGTTVTTATWYNATNDLTFQSEGNGSALQLVTKYGYDGSGHLTSINLNCTSSGTVPPSDASTCTGAGTQDTSTNLITTFTYTANDQVQNVTDPLGRITRHAYDTDGNETSVTSNYVSGQSLTADRNVVTNFAFNQATTAGKAGLVTAMWSPNDPLMIGTPTTFTYDLLGRQLTEALPGDSTIPALTRSTTYDEFGNVLTDVESWTGVTRTTTHAYDKANRETSATDPVGVASSTSYNAAGNATSSIEGGIVTYRLFDGMGRAVCESATAPPDTCGALDTLETRHTYDPASNERATIDAAGVTTTRNFDREGRLLSETVFDGSGELTTGFEYDVLGRAVRTSDPEGAVTTSFHDRPGQLICQAPEDLANILACEASELRTWHAYDRAGNLLSVKHPGLDGEVAATVVDALNREVQTIANCTNSGTTRPAGGVVCTGAGTHDETTNITTTTYYDAAGNVVAKKGPDGVVVRSFPNVRSLTWKSIANCTNSGATPPADPATCTGSGTPDTKTNVISTISFDGSGASLMTIVAVGLGTDEATTETAYDAAGRVQATRDALGTVTRTFYDGSGRLSSSVVNCTNTGTTVPTSNWASCAATGTSDATWNVTTSYTYNARGNRETETAPGGVNGRVTKFIFDAADRVIERIENYTAGSPADDQNLTTYTEYDEAGRVKAVRAPTTNRNTFTVTRYIYDANGRLTSEIKNCTTEGTASPQEPDWRGCTGGGTSDWQTNLLTTFTYDERGNRLSATAPDPSDTTTDVTTVTTYFAYDDADRLCRVLEAATTDLQSLADPCTTAVSGTVNSNLSTRYTYDPAGNLASMVDARGNTTNYAYDEQGQMTGLTDALSNTLSWSYDALGRKTGQTNRSTGTVTWTYDAAGRALSRSATSVATVHYTYDDNGNRLTVGFGGGQPTITTTYDRLNRPTQVVLSDDPGATTTYTYSFTSPTWSDASGTYTATIDKFGRETGLLDPIHGASAWTAVYRADGQPATLAAPNGNTTAWTYDASGRPNGSGTTGAGPVTRASYSYTLNRAGQRLSEASTITGDPTNGTVNFTYDALGRLTGYSGTPVTSQNFGWDKVPNRTSKQVGGGGAITTTYNNANRPTSDSAGGTYTNDLDGRLTGRPAQTLVWDALGRLTQVKDPITSANISTYTYDPLDRLLTVSNGAGLTKFRYVGATTQIAQARDLNNVVLYNVGTSLAGAARMDWGAGGTNRRLYGTNLHGDLTWTAGSTGTVTATLRSDPWGIPGTSSGGSLPSFRFQGSWYDTSSALSWIVTRWYAPGLGRFISEDSLQGFKEHPGSRHRYAYAMGEPIRGWDPDGMYCPTCTPPWVGKAIPRSNTFAFPNRTRMRGRLELGLFIADKYQYLGVRTYGDDRDFSPPAYTDCFRSRGCIKVDFSNNVVRVRVNPTCADFPNPFGGWMLFGCEDAFKTTDDPLCVLWGDGKCNFVAVRENATTGVIDIRWSITQSKLPIVRPINTVEGRMVVYPSAVARQPRLVDYWGEGFPHEEMYWVRPDSTRAKLFRHPGPNWGDMAPGGVFGDWSRSVPVLIPAYDGPIYA
jgi:RHS repeat-associated protein